MNFLSFFQGIELPTTPEAWEAIQIGLGFTFGGVISWIIQRLKNINTSQTTIRVVLLIAGLVYGGSLGVYSTYLSGDLTWANAFTSAMSGVSLVGGSEIFHQWWNKRVI